LYEDAFFVGIYLTSTCSGLRCQSTGRLVLTAKRRKSSKYPKTLASLGDHLRARRLELGLYQSQVAEILGVTESTVTNWEKNRTEPQLYLIPKVIEFLGYIPESPEARTLGKSIALYRRVRGTSQEKFAQELDVDPSTLRKWERNKGTPTQEVREKLCGFFKEVCPSTTAQPHFPKVDS